MSQDLENPPNYGSTDQQQSTNSQGYQSVDNGASKGLLSTSSRMQFIRKVYSILTTQLLLTVLICYAAITNEGFNNFLKNPDYIALLFVCFGVTIVLIIILICYQNTAREVPLNYILLFLFTLCESYIVAFMCVQFNTRLVLMAATLTLVMFLTLTIYALTTDTDVTTMGAFLAVFGMVMLAGALFLMFTDNLIAHLIYCCLGVILFSIYIIYDTQLLLENKKYGYTIDDYVIASLMLYIDIINLFIYILEILGYTD